MKFYKVLTFMLLSLFAATSASAQLVTEKGMALIEYERRLSTEDKQNAIDQAALNAVERYMAASNSARIRMFNEYKADLTGRLDAIIVSTTMISEEEDKKANTYQVVVSADISAAQLDDFFNSVAADQSASSGPASLLTFLFVARMQSSVQTFEDRVYTRTEESGAVSAETSASRDALESERITSSSVGTSDSVDESISTEFQSSSTSTTGGSTTRKSDKVKWTVTNASEINTVMTGAFSEAGFDVVEAEFVEAESAGLLSIENVRAEYSTGDDLTSGTLRNTTSGIRNAGIPYVAIGTLDVGVRDIDPVSGNTRVYVTVTGKVLDVSSRFPRTLSSVGPIQFAGLGPSETVARTNALTNAAEGAAAQMVDELNAKGIR